MNKEVNKTDVKALAFRDELIKLCNKYDCNISGSCRDDEIMVLEMYDKEADWTTYYEMQDNATDYNLSKDDEDYNTECIMDKVIRKAFDKESGEIVGLNNVKVSCGVITNDWSKAYLKFQELRCKYTDEEVANFIISDDYMQLVLANGDWYKWIKPKLNSKGYRCGKIIIDRNITLEELNEVVLPICCYCGRNDVEIF